MPTRTLDRTFVFGGKFYGPGTLDVPDALAERVDQVMGAEGALVERRPEPAASPIGRPAVLDPRIAATLARAGYVDEQAIRAASDDDLLAVDGIGQASLRQIREVYGEPGAEE
jgi:hypothetical protein